MRRVAQALGVQESTVSRNIAAIEQYLNVQLFDRHNDGVQLTAEGKDWLASARGHFDGLEDALVEAAQRDEKTTVLRIGLGVPVGQESLLRLVNRFRKRYPNVDVSIRDGAASRLIAAVRRRRLDVAFVDGCCNVNACSAEMIWQEELSVLLPADHPLAPREALTWEDFSNERLLVPMGVDGPQVDPASLQILFEGMRAPEIEYCQAGPTTVAVKVKLGKGITLGDMGSAQSISIDGTVWRRITGRNSSCQIKAAWLDTNPEHHVLRLVAIAKGMTDQEM